MTPATQTLAAWLLEQIAADEAVARAAMDYPDGDRIVASLPTPIFDALRAGFPAHVLAVCEAHRRIVELHPVDAAPVERHPKWTDEQNARFRAQYGYRDGQELAYGCETCDAFDDGLVFHGASEGCPTLRALAAIYADRDGFREEWR